MEIDWSKAPEGAEFYAEARFRKISSDEYPDYWSHDIWIPGGFSLENCKDASDYTERPKEWPATDERIDRIGRDRTTEDMGHYSEQQKEEIRATANNHANKCFAPPKTSAEYLSECLRVQTERGKQYDARGTGERSFAAAASAFNAATGKSLTGSDACLLLAMVKLVRQYSSPDRLHQDSLLDGVSYLSLWAEELTKELGK
jgi:hypothetical protein